MPIKDSGLELDFIIALHIAWHIAENKIIKKLVSSGTSGQKVSKIYLDKRNAVNQAKVLNKIMSTILGKERLPMLIIDQNPRLRDISVFNAFR